MSRKNRTTEKAVNAVDIIEQATSLLRSAPLETIAVYYIGTIPFITALVWFWADMSRSPDAAERLAGSSLGLALLFVWMKVFHARFSMRLLAMLGGHQSLPPLRQTILIQWSIQPWSIIVLPLAAILTIPFGWCYAFFHNISSITEPSLRSATSRAKNLAMLWPMQNHILISLLTLLGFVIFINIATATLFLPGIIKSLMGFDIMLTRGGQFFLTSTFWFAVAAVTHLCIDPVVKASYLIRCHYGEALATGADLRALLKGAEGFTRSFVIALFASLIFSLLMPLNAVASSAPDKGKQISVVNLDRAIDKTLKDPVFSWRTPRKSSNIKQKELPGFMQSTINWCRDALKTVGSWFERLLKWIFESLTRAKPAPEKGSQWGKGFSDIAMPLLYLLMAILICTGAVYAWRHLRYRPEGKDDPTLHLVTTVTPDIADEAVTADELPESGWTAIARDLFSKGEIRLGLRALYLATLASLAEASLIGIARFKTNHDYEREVCRFSHTMPELADAFSANLMIFEQTWYGMHLPDQTTINRFIENHRKMTSGAV